MEHWFDGATKFVAGASVARRDELRNATIAGVAALLLDLSWGRSMGLRARVLLDSERQTATAFGCMALRWAFLLTATGEKLQNSSRDRSDLRTGRLNGPNKTGNGLIHSFKSTWL